MYKYYIAILFSLFSSSTVANESQRYKDFKQGLDDHINKIESSLAFYQEPTLRTQQSIQQSAFIFENRELDSAGKGLLEYLESQHSIYYQLPFDEWLLASEDLLEVDSWLGDFSAWGNLVIKINICNKVLYRILNYLEENRSSLDDDKLTKMIALQQKLRNHLPSRLAIYEIALRHHGMLSKRSTRKFNFDPKQENESNYIEDKITLYFNDEVDLQKSFEKIHNIENGAVIHNYVDLYDHPLPLSVAQTARYHGFAWDIYLYSSLIRNSGLEGNDWPELKPSEVVEILENEKRNVNGFWMTKFYRLYTVNPDKNSVEYIIEDVQSGAFLERTLRSFERSKNRKYLMNENSKRFRLFSPHIMP